MSVNKIITVNVPIATLARIHQLATLDRRSMSLMLTLVAEKGITPYYAAMGMTTEPPIDDPVEYLKSVGITVPDESKEPKK